MGTRSSLKQAIHSAVVEKYRQWYGLEHMERGSCLYWTLTGIHVLHSLGYRALLQAGSLSWPIITPEQDNGTQPTHFTYEWSPHRPESQAALILGLLPEIHIWIGLPDEDELVDFSTKWLPQQAHREGLEWHTQPPPDFLWCGPADLPAQVVYQPDVNAIRFAIQFIHHQRNHQQKDKT